MGIIEKKYKERYRIVRDVLLIVLAFFFIIVGFLFGSVKLDPDMQFQHIRMVW